MKENKTSNLVIHSVHDSTLELLTHALGIWDGEMMTIEIYSQKGDESGYLFRIMRKGKFVPYPLCDYDDNVTQLCDLGILLNDSFSDIVSQKEWSTDICGNLVSDCRCGYCTAESTEDNCYDEIKPLDTA